MRCSDSETEGNNSKSPTRFESKTFDKPNDTAMDDDCNDNDTSTQKPPFQPVDIAKQDDDVTSLEAKEPAIQITAQSSKVMPADIPPNPTAMPGIQTNLNFPQRLRKALDDENNQKILRWLDHGLSFKVFAKDDFEQKILPTYFQKQSKYWSFTRKLGRWGFTRITSGSESGSYQHPLFRRDEPDLLAQMTCQSSNVGVAAAATQPRGPSQRNTVAELRPASQNNSRQLQGKRSMSSVSRSQQFGQSLPTNLDQASKILLLGEQSRQLDPLLSTNHLYPNLRQSHSPLDLIAEQQRQHQLLQFASRSSATAAGGSPMASLFESGFGVSGNASSNSLRGMDFLEQRERILTQEILRQQMQQDEEKLLFQLMIESRRNQLAGTQQIDLLARKQPNLTYANLGNGLNFLQTQQSPRALQNIGSASLEAASADHHGGEISSQEREQRKTHQTKKEKHDQDEMLATQALQLHQQKRLKQQSQEKKSPGSHKSQK